MQKIKDKLIIKDGQMFRLMIYLMTCKVCGKDFKAQPESGHYKTKRCFDCYFQP